MQAPFRKNYSAALLPLHIRARKAHVLAMEMPRHTALTLSQMLTDAVNHGTGAYISIADLVAGIKTQALALLLLLFALPNVLPSLPGTSAITGLPLVLLTLQMTLGQGVWLPRVIANRAVPRAGLLTVLHKSLPYLAKIERLMHPRQFWLTSVTAQRLLGLLMLVLSVIIMLPIPLANTLPSLAIAVIAVGLIERDGYFILAGLLITVGAIFVMITVYWTLITFALSQITAWF